jgi:predicted transcriptional regulator
MNKMSKVANILERAKNWPEEDQAALAEFAREIESHRGESVYVMTPDERAAVERGLAQANRGEFATDEEMKSLRARFGAA